MKQTDDSAYYRVQSTTSFPGSSLYPEKPWTEHESSSRETIHSSRDWLVRNLQSLCAYFIAMLSHVFEVTLERVCREDSQSIFVTSKVFNLAMDCPFYNAFLS